MRALLLVLLLMLTLLFDISMDLLVGGLSLSRVFALSLLFFFTTVVTIAPIAFALLSKVIMVGVTRLELLNSPLQLAEVKFQVFIDFPHLEVLLFKVLSALRHLLELLVEPELIDPENCHFLFCFNQLLRDIRELPFKLIQTGQLMLLDHFEAVFQLKLFFEHTLEFDMEVFQITLGLPLIPLNHLSIALLLNHLELKLSLSLKQRCRFTLGPGKGLNTVIKLVDLL